MKKKEKLYIVEFTKEEINLFIKLLHKSMRDDLGSWFEFSYRNGKFDWLKLEDLDQSYFSNVFRVIDPDNLTPLEKFFIKIRKKFQ